MKTRIFNLIIIDESGSMNSIKQAAINNVNETIQTIRFAQEKYEDQEHYVTLVTFNNDVKTVYECVEVDKVVELTEETYIPSRCTALYDAIGMSLTALKPKVAEIDKVLVTIITDGYENFSKQYSGVAISFIVNELKEKGWVFAYIGANHDVASEAHKISIANTMHFDATEEGMDEMSAKVCNARSNLYSRWHDIKDFFSTASANEDFFNEDEW